MSRKLKIRWWQHRVGSSPTTGTSSSQASYRLRRVFSFHCKTHRALILLLLTSKTDPLSLGSDLGPPLRGGFVYPSEQSPRCFGIFLCPGQKRHHPPAPLLPLPNCDPLCWARSWQTALRGSLSCPFSESFGWRVYQQPRGPEWTHVLSDPRGCLCMG